MKSKHRYNRDRDGKLLIAGRKMTGVSDKQVKELGIEETPGDGVAQGRRHLFQAGEVQRFLRYYHGDGRRKAFCYRAEPELQP